MQFPPVLYDPERHDEYMCLTVKNPYATWIGDGSKTIEVRSRPTNYRGRLLIGSSKRPIIEGMESACTICLVDLVDCIPVRDMTFEQWAQTRIDAPQSDYIEHYGWVLKNVNRVVEYPMRGQLGIFRTCFDKNDIQIYPNNVILDVSHDELKKLHKTAYYERIFGGYFSKSRRIIRAAKWRMGWGLVKMAWPLWAVIALISGLVWIILL